jgi:oxygen-independent coproporphyrinogen-3 oxidase
MNIEGIFRIRLNDPKLNTSYPLNPVDWAKYKIEKKHPFLTKEALSFYIHIPFCTSICSFCEYTKMLNPNEQLQFTYLKTLERDIKEFIIKHPDITLFGFDIGGGTPTALSEDNFAYLIDIFKNTVNTVKLSQDFEPSIEATFNTLSLEKLRKIHKAGINRISLGIQSTQKEVLSINKRDAIPLKIIKKWISIIKHTGIQKINLDFMYGLKGQSIKEIELDIAILKELNVEQVTLYELRTNIIKYEKGKISREKLFESYLYLYNNLIKLGYFAQFGQNTFSLNQKDLGVSSYLRNRMIKAMAYKGFGVSAQSMNQYGISYNIGKNKTKLSNYIKQNSFEMKEFYKLPKRELLSKYIAISGYYGRFSIDIASEISSEDFYTVFRAEIDFCIKNKLIEIKNKDIRITHKGFKNYGTVFSLFFISNYYGDSTEQPTMALPNKISDA